jgi:hypothetical protein
MLLLLTIIIILFFIISVNYILPIFKRYSQLQKDYRNITLLPLSSIPFVGNLHHFDKQQHVVFQLVLRLSKECQDQNKGVFCLWYSLWPTVILCSGKGLEVFTFNIISKIFFLQLI